MQCHSYLELSFLVDLLDHFQYADKNKSPYMFTGSKTRIKTPPT